MIEQDKGQQEQDWRDSQPFDSKKYKNFYQLAGGVFITVVILLMGGFIYSSPESGYWVNIYATIVGTILTIAVLDRRAEHRAIRERKEELILQMGSPDNGFAVEAARLLRQKGWLYDTSLQKAGLYAANLQGARLSRADFQGADLHAANLQGAKLSQSNLAGVFLYGANLQRADFSGANLQQADIDNNKFDTHTILPDGTFWTPDRDMRQFTDPNHQNFWRSRDPDSPAYRGAT